MEIRCGSPRGFGRDAEIPGRGRESSSRTVARQIHNPKILDPLPRSSGGRNTSPEAETSQTGPGPWESAYVRRISGRSILEMQAALAGR